jgi:hypothetical protein
MFETPQNLSEPREPIYAIGASARAEPLVDANPQFQDMMAAIAALERYV